MQYAFLVYAQIIRGVNEINSLAPRERLETLRTKKSLKLHKVACEQALRGALAAGREKEREVATTFLEFEFHLQFPCGTPSTELSDFRQSARSGKEREYKQTLKKSCQG